MGRMLLVLLVLLMSAAPGAAVDGAALWAEACASCHGASGQSETPTGQAMEVPKL